MSRVKRGLLIALISLVSAALLFGGSYLLRWRHYVRTVEEITLSDVNLSSLADGGYLGECDADFVAARVRVTIQGGRITAIEVLEHRNGRGTAAEILPARIVAAQSPDVDAVAGATNSSRVICKAVENALCSGAEN